ncbi:hypothetical protein JXM67_01970 [candidate division WOR-3 bacterium]|nr:hypothetical protein [candidate division WOR-3 bacterium]
MKNPENLKLGLTVPLIEVEDFKGRRLKAVYMEFKLIAPPIVRRIVSATGFRGCRLHVVL